MTPAHDHFVWRVDERFDAKGTIELQRAGGVVLGYGELVGTEVNWQALRCARGR